MYTTWNELINSGEQEEQNKHNNLYKFYKELYMKYCEIVKSYKTYTVYVGDPYSDYGEKWEEDITSSTIDEAVKYYLMQYLVLSSEQLYEIVSNEPSYETMILFIAFFLNEEWYGHDVTILPPEKLKTMIVEDFNCVLSLNDIKKIQNTY